MTNEEYEKALDKANELAHLLSSIAERCYIAENARLKVGDITTPPNSTELYKVSEVRVHDFGSESFDYDLNFPKFVHDIDILYILRKVDDYKERKHIRQKELFKTELK